MENLTCFLMYKAHWHCTRKVEKLLSVAFLKLRDLGVLYLWDGPWSMVHDGERLSLSTFKSRISLWHQQKAPGWPNLTKIIYHEVIIRLNKTLPATGVSKLTLTFLLSLVYKLRRPSRCRVGFGHTRLFFGSRSADPDVITSTLANVAYRKLNYQLIPLADVDARSCVLFGHCVALICLWHWRHIKAEKGARRAFSGWRACDWSGKRLTARTLGLFSATAEELAPKAWTSAETRKKNSKRQPT